MELLFKIMKNVMMQFQRNVINVSLYAKFHVNIVIMEIVNNVKKVGI